MSIYRAEQSQDTHWATWKYTDLLPHLFGQMDTYYERLDHWGVLDLWQQCYDAYYSTNVTDGHSGSQIKFVGPNKQRVAVQANIFRNLLKHQLNTITAMTPDTIPVAANNEYSTKAQIHACKDVLEHYRKEDKIPKKYKKCVEYYLLYSMGYLVEWWDSELQELRNVAATPRRVIFDLESYHDPQWYIYAERINRFDAKAKYNISDNDLRHLNNHDNKTSSAIPGYYFDTQVNVDNNYVDIYHFWHGRTPALPEGRYTIFGNDHISFTEHLSEALPFEYMPVHRLMPEDIAESAIGYSPAYDLLGPQKLVNATLSTVFTGQNNAKTIVAAPVDTTNPMPVGADPNFSICYYPTTQPHSGVHTLNTFNVPDQLFKTLEMVQALGQQLSGLNETAMGSSGAKSGSHAALLFSTTQQFQSNTIAAFVELIEECDTSRISLIKSFLPGEILLRIAGGDKEVYLEAFKREQISNIAGVVRAQGVSPILATPPGRMSVGQDLMKLPGSTFTAKDYLKLLDTGQLDSSFTDMRDEDMVLSAERTALSNPDDLSTKRIKLNRFDGTPDELEVVAEVRALITDNHFNHLKDHTALLSSPQVRNNETLSGMVFAHCAEHIWLSKYGSRSLLLASGQQPMPTGAAEPPQEKPVPVGANPQIAETAQTGGPYNSQNVPKMPNQPDNPMNPTVSVEQPAASTAMQESV